MGLGYPTNYGVQTLFWLQGVGLPSVWKAVHSPTPPLSGLSTIIAYTRLLAGGWFER